MTSQSSIVEKVSTFLNETIHITLGCAIHLHGHQNKVVPLMKAFILANFNNGVKFCNCTYWLTNDIRSHCLSHRINTHHISNENLLLSSHVKNGL
jgi:hypothetical protein